MRVVINTNDAYFKALNYKALASGTTSDVWVEEEKHEGSTEKNPITGAVTALLSK